MKQVSFTWALLKGQKIRIQIVKTECLLWLPISKRGFSQFFAHLPFERVDQLGQEALFAFLCGAVTALSAPEPGIEQIPHGIAEHVEGVDDNRQAKPRPQG